MNPGNLGRFALLHPQTLETMRAFDYGTFVRIDIEDDGTPKKLVQHSLRQPDGSVGTVKEMRSFDL
ncbi:hypothetical protein HY492_00785 [Candidatus Woesearchaeota archaeon]|nr:hypothetical protein [Candidatus Woesearchaeota archaeon]